MPAAPTVSIGDSGPTYFGIPVTLTCFSLLPQSNDFTSFGVHVVWNITVTENGQMTSMSFPSTNFSGVPAAFVNATFSYTFFSRDFVVVSCSSILSATRDGSTFTSGTGVATTLLHVVGKSDIILSHNHSLEEAPTYKNSHLIP